MIGRALEHLRDPSAVARARLTCKAWAASVSNGLTEASLGFAHPYETWSLPRACPPAWGARLLSGLTRLDLSIPHLEDTVRIADAPLWSLKHITLRTPLTVTRSEYWKNVQSCLTALFASGAPLLESLELVNFYITTSDIPSLLAAHATTPRLSALFMSGCAYRDFDAVSIGVSAIVSLTTLDMSSNGLRCNLSSAPSLTRLTRLSSLNMSSNHLGAVTGTYAFPDSLTSLDISNNPVTQAIFAALPVSLTILKLGDTSVEDGASGALARLTRLTTLNLSETLVTDAIAAELPVSLTSLSLAQNDISTAGVGALARLTRLILLDISFCSRVDLSSGIRLPRLEMLKASGLSVESLSAFDGTPSLSNVMVHLQEEGTIDVFIHLHEMYAKSFDNTNWLIEAANGHWIDINPDGSFMI